ncbi:3'5'-cyclic nucleotide phosphodiesterase domain-containing protein [Toxoplasma gondii VAND]|uniref:Phosphodiesterase n=1 Tax=Toxoplasma gondii VAND TaxID=933077 RepID=A0A086QKG3_TOXGO|nr:3'5'-cyclic nucleotide phosphodiesterase domain-containing protein [Toxoplasma gondii VAND]
MECLDHVGRDTRKADTPLGLFSRSSSFRAELPDLTESSTRVRSEKEDVGAFIEAQQPVEPPGMETRFEGTLCDDEKPKATQHVRGKETVPSPAHSSAVASAIQTSEDSERPQRRKQTNSRDLGSRETSPPLHALEAKSSALPQLFQESSNLSVSLSTSQSGVGSGSMRLSFSSSQVTASSSPSRLSQAASFPVSTTQRPVREPRLTCCERDGVGEKTVEGHEETHRRGLQGRRVGHDRDKDLPFRMHSSSENSDNLKEVTNLVLREGPFTPELPYFPLFVGAESESGTLASTIGAKRGWEKGENEDETAAGVAGPFPTPAEQYGVRHSSGGDTVEAAFGRRFRHRERREVIKSCTSSSSPGDSSSHSFFSSSPGGSASSPEDALGLHPALVSLSPPETGSLLLSPRQRVSASQGPYQRHRDRPQFEGHHRRGEAEMKTPAEPNASPSSQLLSKIDAAYRAVKTWVEDSFLVDINRSLLYPPSPLFSRGENASETASYPSTSLKRGCLRGTGSTLMSPVEANTVLTLSPSAGGAPQFGDSLDSVTEKARSEGTVWRDAKARDKEERTSPSFFRLARWGHTVSPSAFADNSASLSPSPLTLARRQKGAAMPNLLSPVSVGGRREAPGTGCLQRRMCHGVSGFKGATEASLQSSRRVREAKNDRDASKSQRDRTRGRAADEGSTTRQGDADPKRGLSGQSETPVSLRGTLPRARGAEEDKRQGRREAIADRRAPSTHGGILSEGHRVSAEGNDNWGAIGEPWRGKERDTISENMDNARVAETHRQTARRSAEVKLVEAAEGTKSPENQLLKEDKVSGLGGAETLQSAGLFQEGRRTRSRENQETEQTSSAEDGWTEEERQVARQLHLSPCGSRRLGFSTRRRGRLRHGGSQEEQDDMEAGIASASSILTPASPDTQPGICVSKQGRRLGSTGTGWRPRTGLKSPGVQLARRELHFRLGARRRPTRSALASFRPLTVRRRRGRTRLRGERKYTSFSSASPPVLLSLQSSTPVKSDLLSSPAVPLTPSCPSSSPETPLGALVSRSLHFLPFYASAPARGFQRHSRRTWSSSWSREPRAGVFRTLFSLSSQLTRRSSPSETASSSPSKHPSRPSVLLSSPSGLDPTQPAEQGPPSRGGKRKRLSLDSEPPGFPLYLKRKPALEFSDPSVESAYGFYLAKMRRMRLVAIGIVLILLNIMYDIPEYISSFSREEAGGWSRGDPPVSGDEASTQDWPPVDSVFIFPGATQHSQQAGDTGRHALEGGTKRLLSFAPMRLSTAVTGPPRDGGERTTKEVKGDEGRFQKEAQAGFLERAHKPGGRWEETEKGRKGDRLRDRNQPRGDTDSDLERYDRRSVGETLQSTGRRLAEEESIASTNGKKAIPPDGKERMPGTLWGVGTRAKNPPSHRSPRTERRSLISRLNKGSDQKEKGRKGAETTTGAPKTRADAPFPIHLKRLRTTRRLSAVSASDPEDSLVLLPHDGVRGENEASKSGFLSSPVPSWMAAVWVSFDVVELVLQLGLTFSGHMPFLRAHTEKCISLALTSTTFLSSLKPILILGHSSYLSRHSPNSAEETHAEGGGRREAPQTQAGGSGRGEVPPLPLQTCLTAVFLRTIVGCVFVDLLCLVRRHQLLHLHRLLFVLSLSLLLLFTVLGVCVLDLPASLFFFAWCLGIASWLVMASCALGGLLSELMHRKTFYSVFAVGREPDVCMQELVDDEKKRKAMPLFSGKNMLEQLTELVKTMEATLAEVDIYRLDHHTYSSFALIRSLQTKCLDVLTSGGDVYAVTWDSQTVPREIHLHCSQTDAYAHAVGSAAPAPGPEASCLPGDFHACAVLQEDPREDEGDADGREEKKASKEEEGQTGSVWTRLDSSACNPKTAFKMEKEAEGEEETGAGEETQREREDEAPRDKAQSRGRTERGETRREMRETSFDRRRVKQHDRFLKAHRRPETTPFSSFDTASDSWECAHDLSFLSPSRLVVDLVLSPGFMPAAPHSHAAPSGQDSESQQESQEGRRNSVHCSFEMKAATRTSAQENKRTNGSTKRTKDVFASVSRSHSSVGGAPGVASPDIFERHPFRVATSSPGLRSVAGVASAAKRDRTKGEGDPGDEGENEASVHVGGTAEDEPLGCPRGTVESRTISSSPKESGKEDERSGEGNEEGETAGTPACRSSPPSRRREIPLSFATRQSHRVSTKVRGASASGDADGLKKVAKAAGRQACSGRPRGEPVEAEKQERKADGAVPAKAEVMDGELRRRSGSPQRKSLRFRFVPDDSDKPSEGEAAWRSTQRRHSLETKNTIGNVSCGACSSSDEACRVLPFVGRHTKGEEETEEEVKRSDSPSRQKMTSSPELEERRQEGQTDAEGAGEREENSKEEKNRMWRRTDAVDTRGELSFDASLRRSKQGASLARVGLTWTLDLFSLDALSNGNVLVAVGLHLLLPHRQRGHLRCSQADLRSFLQNLQSLYLPNLYHNRVHAAMVAHLSVFLSRTAGMSPWPARSCSSCRSRQASLRLSPECSWGRGDVETQETPDASPGLSEFPSTQLHSFASNPRTTLESPQDLAVCRAAGAAQEARLQSPFRGSASQCASATSPVRQKERTDKDASALHEWCLASQESVDTRDVSLSPGDRSDITKRHIWCSSRSSDALPPRQNAAARRSASQLLSRRRSFRFSPHHSPQAPACPPRGGGPSNWDARQGEICGGEEENLHALEHVHSSHGGPRARASTACEGGMRDGLAESERRFQEAALLSNLSSREARREDDATGLCGAARHGKEDDASEKRLLQGSQKDAQEMTKDRGPDSHHGTERAPPRMIDDETILCFAALGHDVGHPGFNNAFLVATNQPIALVYNDHAVLENYHAYITFRTLTCYTSTTDTNGQGCEGSVLKGITPAEYRYFRKHLIELILATDMSQHFSTISTVRVRRESRTFNFITNEEDRWMMKKLCMKIGDIGHAALDWDQHYKWSMRVTEEFLLQGDAELKAGLPVSPLCDRNAPEIELHKSQSSFINYLVVPLINELVGCLEAHPRQSVAPPSLLGSETTEKSTVHSSLLSTTQTGDSRPHSRTSALSKAFSSSDVTSYRLLHRYGRSTMAAHSPYLGRPGTFSAPDECWNEERVPSGISPADTIREIVLFQALRNAERWSARAHVLETKTGKTPAVSVSGFGSADASEGQRAIGSKRATPGKEDSTKSSKDSPRSAFASSPPHAHGPGASTPPGPQSVCGASFWTQRRLLVRHKTYSPARFGFSAEDERDEGEDRLSRDEGETGALAGSPGFALGKRDRMRERKLKPPRRRSWMTVTENRKRREQEEQRRDDRSRVKENVLRGILKREKEEKKSNEGTRDGVRSSTCRHANPEHRTNREDRKGKTSGNHEMDENADRSRMSGTRKPGNETWGREKDLEDHQPHTCEMLPQENEITDIAEETERGRAVESAGTLSQKQARETKKREASKEKGKGARRHAGESMQTSQMSLETELLHVEKRVCETV